MVALLYMISININVIIFLIAIIVATWHEKSMYIVEEGFKSEEHSGQGGLCPQLDQRDCHDAPRCGWCIDSDGNGRCKKGDSLGPFNKSADCNNGWTSGWPWSKARRVPFYYPGQGYFSYPSWNWNPFK